mgnify:CR=1 FL=1
MTPLSEAMYECLDDMGLKYQREVVEGEGAGAGFTVCLPNGEAVIYLRSLDASHRVTCIGIVADSSEATCPREELQLLCSIATDNCCLGSFYLSSTDNDIELKSGFGLGLVPNGLYGSGAYPPMKTMKRMVFDLMLTITTTLDAWFPAFDALMNGQGEVSARQAVSEGEWFNGTGSVNGFQINDGDEMDYGGGGMDIVRLGEEE